MNATDRRKTAILFRIVIWAGVACFVYGVVITLTSTVAFVQVRTGWGLTTFERCCRDLAVASLGGALSGMFFALLGSAVILLLQPIRLMRLRKEGRGLGRWPKVLAAIMAVYALGVFAFATSVAGMSELFDSFTPGIVTYCMLVGVGMLGVAWGFKRASEVS
jgi:hypothetical protein